MKNYLQIIKAIFAASVILFFNHANAQWVQQTSGTTSTLNSVYFTNATNGYVAGASGTIKHTTNGGSTWATQTSGITSNLNSIFFIKTLTAVGYAAGDNGVVLKTVTAGSNWSTLPTGITDLLHSAYFTNYDTGYVAGANGKILRTNDGGATWATQTTGTTNELYSLYFLDTDTGFAVGTLGTILKTKNGGTTWTQKTSGTPQILTSVYFASADTGYIVGFNGTALKSVDGGESWALLTPGTNILYGVSCPNGHTAYAVGDVSTNKSIVKTSNGGTSWTVQTNPTTQWLQSVYFVNDTVGYACGWNGTILKTQTGGNPVAVNELQIVNNEVEIYPNPNNGIFQVSSSKYQISSIEVYSVKGEKVYSTQILNPKSSIFNLNLPDGIYFLKLKTDNGIVNKKIAIEHK